MVSRENKHEDGALADAAVELPALLLDALDAGHRLHAPVINSADLRDPVHAGGMAPQPCLCGGLQSAPLNGTQTALGWLAVILQHCKAQYLRTGSIGLMRWILSSQQVLI